MVLGCGYRVADQCQRFIRIGEGQQIVEEAATMAGPGQMFGKPDRLIARDQVFQSSEMLTIQRCRAANRQTDPVQGNIVVLTDAGEVMMRWSTVAHVVFRMDFEPADGRRYFKDLALMLSLETDSGQLVALICHWASPDVWDLIDLMVCPSGCSNAVLHDETEDNRFLIVK